MKNLSWWEARAIARLELRPIRRDGWQRWLTFHGFNVWKISSPGDPALEPPVEPITARVALASDFAAGEFFARDWTDEDWRTPVVVDPPTNPPGGGDSTPGTNPPGGSTPGTGGGTVTGNPGGDSTPGTGNPGGGWGGGGNPPGPGAEPDPNTPGGGGGGTGGGGGEPPGDPNAPDPNNPNDPASYDYTPTVTVTLSPGADGPGCWINTTLVHGKAHVTVTIPDPLGGPLKAGTISVGNGGGNKLGSMGPGSTQTFEFDLPVNPGGTVTYSATFSGGTGKVWTGKGSAKWQAACILQNFTWSGTRTTTHRCDPPPDSTGDPPVHGYDEVDTYTASAQYAINPEPPGTKSAPRTAVNVGPFLNRKLTNTPYPDGAPTVTESHLSPPGSITCTVSASGVVSDVSPNKLNVFSTDGDGTSTEGECTTTISSGETGPS